MNTGTDIPCKMPHLTSFKVPTKEDLNVNDERICGYQRTLENYKKKKDKFVQKNDPTLQPVVDIDPQLVESNKQPAKRMCQGNGERIVSDDVREEMFWFKKEKKSECTGICTRSCKNPCHNSSSYAEGCSNVRGKECMGHSALSSKRPIDNGKFSKYEPCNQNMLQLEEVLIQPCNTELLTNNRTHFPACVSTGKSRNNLNMPELEFVPLEIHGNMGSVVSDSNNCGTPTTGRLSGRSCINNYVNHYVDECVEASSSDLKNMEVCQKKSAWLAAKNTKLCSVTLPGKRKLKSTLKRVPPIIYMKNGIKFRVLFGERQGSVNKSGSGKPELQNKKEVPGVLYYCTPCATTSRSEKNFKLHDKSLKHRQIVQNIVEVAVKFMKAVGHSLKMPHVNTYSLELVEVLEEEVEFEDYSSGRRMRKTFIYDITLLEQLNKLLAETRVSNQQPEVPISQFLENLQQKKERITSFCFHEDSQGLLKSEDIETQHRKSFFTEVAETIKTKRARKEAQKSNNLSVFGNQESLVNGNSFRDFGNPTMRARIKRQTTSQEAEWVEEQMSVPDGRFHYNNGYYIKRRCYPGRVVVSKRIYNSYRNKRQPHNVKLGHSAVKNSHTPKPSDSSQASSYQPLSPYYPHPLISKPQELYDDSSHKKITTSQTHTVIKDVNVPHVLYDKSGQNYVDLDKPNEFYSFTVDGNGDITTTIICNSVNKFSAPRNMTPNKSSVFGEEINYLLDLNKEHELFIGDGEVSSHLYKPQSYEKSVNEVKNFSVNQFGWSSSLNTPVVSPVPERSEKTFGVDNWLNFN